MKPGNPGFPGFIAINEEADVCKTKGDS